MKKLLLTLLLASAAVAHAATAPTLIPFQGRLTDQAGMGYTNGQFTLIFNLYDQAVGGNVLWTETHQKVGVVNGMVNVFLGSINPALSGVDFSQTRHLGITIDADNNPNTPDPEMVPRQMIIPAFWAKKADDAGNAAKLANFTWTDLLGNANPTLGIPGSKIQTGSIAGTQLANATVTSTQIAPGTINSNQIALGSISLDRLQARTTNGTAVGVIYSQVFSASISSTDVDQDIAASNITFTPSGRPVMVMLQPAPGTEGQWFYGANGVGLDCYITSSFVRSGTVIAKFTHRFNYNGTSTVTHPLSQAYIDFPAAGVSVTYSIRARKGNGVTSALTLSSARLVVFEL